MTGIIDNSDGIWSFRQKVAQFEQALNQERDLLLTIADEAEHQVKVTATRLNQAAADITRDESERYRTQRLLEDFDGLVLRYRSAREEVFHLIGADPTVDSSQRAQAFLVRLGQTIDEYYGLDKRSSGSTTVDEYIAHGVVSGAGVPATGQANAKADPPKTLTPDRDAWFRRGIAAVQQRVEAYKDDLRDKGYSEDKVESMGNAEYGRIMHDEFGPDFNHWGESI